MTPEHLWSLRLGFSVKQASQIKQLGLAEFLDESLQKPARLKEPVFLKDAPKTLAELKAYRLAMRDKTSSKNVKKNSQHWLKIKTWWLERMDTATYPLHEKLNLFWQNHFVTTLQAVKVPYWHYQHYQIIHDHALGNYRTLVKKMMYSNALLTYLSNNKNRKGKINENLGRELLELFTLGEGHYTEADIKNTARALAGLTVGDDGGKYRRPYTDTGVKTVFGQTGYYNIDQVIDIIFEQPQVSFFITKKLLQWFIYDDPPQELVITYGERLMALNYELAPFLKELFLEEYGKDTVGSQMKSPVVFALQVCDALNLKNPNYRFLAFFLKAQGMDLFDQPNVKGWDGGKSWLTTQTYLNRQQLVDLLTSGNERFIKQFPRGIGKFNIGTFDWNAHMEFEPTSKAKTIIQDVTDAHMSFVNDDLKVDMDQLLKYDFDASAENAQESVLRLFNFIAKTPEFQII